MLSCPVDISLLELLTECPDDCGEMWILIINMLKGGDERPHGCGGLSRSRRLSARSRLRTKTERATMRGAYAFAVQEAS